MKQRNLLTILAAGALLAPLTYAQTAWTNGGAGSDWSTGGNWDSGLPAAGNAPTLDIAGTSNQTTSFTGIDTILIGGGHTVQKSGAANLTTQSGNHIYLGTAAGDGVLVNNGTGNVDSGASVRLGFTAGSTGTYTQHSTGTGSGAGGWTVIGESGVGVFNMNGGEWTSGSDLYIARLAGSSGTLNVTAGTIRTASGRFVRLGTGGDATLNISGGRLFSANDMEIAETAGNDVVINVSGSGELLMAGSADFWLGRRGNATLNQTGGTVTTPFTFNAIGAEVGAVGIYNLSSGSLDASSSSTFSVGLRGSGTLNLSGDGDAFIGGLHIDRDSVGSGTVHQTGGSMRAPSVSIGSSGVYNLEGGTMRADSVTLAAGGAFTADGGTIALHTTSGSIGATDHSSVGFEPVRVGRQFAVTGDLTTSGSGLSVDIGGIYLNNGNRFNQLNVTGTLDLGGSADSILTSINAYLLRPFSGLGPAAEEFGSLPLITAGTLTGGIESILGVSDDGRGFAESGFAVTDGSALDVNTWYLENDTADGTVWFHYKVSGYVPEPSTLGLLTLGLLFVRRIRRRKTGV